MITDTGALKPIAYDFDARFDVASLEGLSPELLRRYKDERLGAFRAWSAAPWRASRTAGSWWTGSTTARV